MRPSFALADRALNVAGGRRVEGLHHEHARLRRVDHRQALELAHSAVGLHVHVEVLDERRAGLAGAHAGELMNEIIDRFDHRFFDIEDGFVRVHGVCGIWV